MFDGLNSQRSGDVRFAGSGPANQYYVVSAVDELATMELPNQGLVGLAGCEVEPGQVFVSWEPGGLDLISNRADLTFGHLGFEQLGDHRHCGTEGWGALLDKVPHCLGHAIQLQRLEHDDNGGTGGVMTHDAALPHAGHHNVRHWPTALAQGAKPAVRQSALPVEPYHRSGGAGY